MWWNAWRARAADKVTIEAKSPAAGTIKAIHIEEGQTVEVGGKTGSLTGENPRGRYDVRLFDPDAKKWETVTVDDRIPCKKGTTRSEFVACDGKELWAVLLEKAFAKFCGRLHATV